MTNDQVTHVSQVKVDLQAKLFAKDFQVQIQVKQDALKHRKRTSEQV